MRERATTFPLFAGERVTWREVPARVCYDSARPRCVPVGISCLDVHGDVAAEETVQRKVLESGTRGLRPVGHRRTGRVQSVMGTKQGRGRWVAAVLAGVVLCSCGRFRGTADRPDAGVQQDEATSAEAGTGHEGQLRRVVRGHIAAATGDEGDARSKLKRAKPYFYREFAEYPDGLDGFEVETRETESRTSPYAAQVQLRKIRYATRLHRKRADASADSDFFRSTGMETITYKLKNGRWTKEGSLFVAERVEENINGEWVPLQEEAESAIASREEERGFFGRMWSSVFGR